MNICMRAVLLFLFCVNAYAFKIKDVGVSYISKKARSNITDKEVSKNGYSITLDFYPFDKTTEVIFFGINQDVLTSPLSSTKVYGGGQVRLFSDLIRLEGRIGVNIINSKSKLEDALQTEKIDDNFYYGLGGKLLIYKKMSIATDISSSSFLSNNKTGGSITSFRVGIRFEF